MYCMIIKPINNFYEKLEKSMYLSYNTITLYLLCIFFSLHNTNYVVAEFKTYSGGISMKQSDDVSGKTKKRVRQDLTGKRFGKLVILGTTEKRKSGAVVWQCKCECGNFCEKTTGELNAGFATSCGCSWRQSSGQEGQRYGRLVAMRPTKERSAKSVVWECKCDCGDMVMVRSTMLTSGHTTSCGCIKKEIDEQRDFKKILTYTDDTCIEFVKDIGKARSSTSTDTGVRGVILKDGKYQAQITFQKKRYYLGRFTRLEDAVKVRKQAEERIKEYVEEYLS